MTLPAEERPLVTDPFHTDELPATPQRDRRLPASLWFEAPPVLLTLGNDLGHDVVGYLRRIHQWLLWRAGPAVDGDTRYMAIDATDLSRWCVFRLWTDGSGLGTGPQGEVHTRFRSWKEALRDT